jgi:hypothetical protein
MCDWLSLCQTKLRFEEKFWWRTLELSSNSTWLLVGSWLFCLQNLPCLVSFWCMRGDSVEVWTKKILYRFIKGQTHFCTSWPAKMSLTFHELIWNVFSSNSTLPPRMHQKLTKHGRFCKQNNQLPTKSHDELEDNSIGSHGSPKLHVSWEWDHHHVPKLKIKKEVLS